MIDSEGGLELTERKTHYPIQFKFQCRFLQSSPQLGVRTQLMATATIASESFQVIVKAPEF